MSCFTASVFADDVPSFIPGAPVPLIADPTVFPYRVPPPTWGRRTLGPSVQSSTINVTFIPNGVSNAFDDSCIGWPAGAQAAFLYAASIWQSYLSSPVPIDIEACWTSLGQGILGHGGSIDFEYNFDGAPMSNTLYPVALANALHGSDLEPGYDDISVAFNNSFSSSLNWYFGTDGIVPVNGYDFVSVVLHELAHGLGFLGTMNVSGGTGSWGWSGIPSAYDTFAVNGSSASLLNTALFPNPSAVLAAQLTGNNVFFNGSNAAAANGNSPVKLYAPSVWRPGSSYAHLDEIFNGTPNALMTYSLSNREAVHAPGPVTIEILKDMGWSINGACTYSLGSSGNSFDLNGGTDSVSVTTSAGCDWTAASNDAWIHVTSGSSGTGNGSVGYSVDSYAGTVIRTGTMTIGGHIFTVTQTGVPPVANFSGTPVSGVLPFQVVFTDSSTNSPTSWLWDFGDGETSTLQDPSHTYKSFGTYTVSLTATNASGFDTMTIPGYITVDPCVNLPVRRAGNPNTSIQASYDEIGSGGTDTINIQAVDITGVLTFGANKTVTLRGGYICDYGLPSIPGTTVIGSITIGAATIIFDSITIQ